MKAVFWGYKYGDMKESWRRQALWLAESLRKNGFEIIRHPTFTCKGFLAKDYDPETDNPCDVVIYNHADISHIKGNVIKADQMWFMKPTIPDEIHTSLDTLGFGPYSTVAYTKPDFNHTDSEEIKKFFSEKVSAWIKDKTTKWATFENKEQDIGLDDYILVIGQCGGDETTTRHDFGSHFTKLYQITKELNRVTDRPIVVKFHPYTDGKDASDDRISQALKGKFGLIDKKVKGYIGKYNIHGFIEKAKCVVLANSGAGYEAMMHHKPIISWGYPEYHWVTYDLRHLADLGRALQLDWFDSFKQDQFLYWYLEKYCFHDQETSDRRVGELLNERS